MVCLTLHSLIKLCVLHAVWIVGVKSQTLTRLGHLNVNKEFVTLSGFSSGGTFAQQLYVSHSSLFSGIAVFSHTYYRCGIGNGILRDYDAVCTTTGNLRNNELYDPSNALGDIYNYFASGLIDDPSHMANKPLYVFAGTQNYLFTADMSLRILQVFEPFINNPHSIKTHVAAANLTLPSNRPDLPGCADPTNSVMVSNCGFSGPLESLQFLLGGEAVTPPQRSIKIQPLLPFDQSEFFYGTGRHDMDQVGFVYVPKVCQSNEIKCLLHFYFHGCSTGREFVGPDHILKSGWLEVAETNGIIMIFPQALSSSPENTIGCWDTYGITGQLYATKKGAQVIVLKNILDRVLGKEFSASRRPYPELVHGPPRSTGPAPSSHSDYAFTPGHQEPHSGFELKGPSSPPRYPLALSNPHSGTTGIESRREEIGPQYFPPQFTRGLIQRNFKTDGVNPGLGTKCTLSMVHPNTIYQRCFNN